MDANKYRDIFDVNMKKISDINCDEAKFMEKLNNYNNEEGVLTTESAVSFAYVTSIDMSIQFMWEIFNDIINSEDFKKDLFDEMIKQAKEEYKRTGKNPFEL